MQLTVPADNNTFISRYFPAEPALSLFMQVQGRTILLDCGFSDVFLRNAETAVSPEARLSLH